MFVSQSVGGAIIIDGKAFYGKSQRGGEFGHMILVPNGRSCYCGRLGCLNAYCSTKNLSDMTNEDLGSFFAGIESGDESLIKVWDEYLDYLALAIHNLNMAFDCEVVIVGYLGQYIGTYIEGLRTRVKSLKAYM